MPVSRSQQQVIEDTSRAMQLGPAGEATILSLFTDDGVWVEPYTGTRRAHAGKEAIRAALRQMWQQPSPPGFTITTDRIDAEGECVRVDWTCHCDGFPAMMRGYSLYTISPENLIARLELFITEAPGPPAAAASEA
jgi:ketosteroid isomerase-like protein